MKQSTYREILDAAIQNEIEANLFYQQVAEKVTNAHLKDMFLKFAREEKKHRAILEGFRDHAAAAVRFTRVPDYHVAETVDEPPLTMDMKPADAIALAMKKEEAAMKHYTQLAQACEDDGQKKLFLELASMEREHKAKMEQAFVDIGYPEVW
jgi:rubrerythrin